MTLSHRTFWIFVLALVAANVATIFVTAAVFKSSPGLREHHPGF